MANINDKIQQIRNATYGKDVRESLASGIEAINTEIISNTSSQAVLEGKQNALENRQNVIDTAESARETIFNSNETARETAFNNKINSISSNIVDNSITPIKTDFFKYTYQDLYNSTTNQNGAFNSDGTDLVLPNYKRSDYISLNGGLTAKGKEIEILDTLDLMDGKQVIYGYTDIGIAGYPIAKPTADETSIPNPAKVVKSDGASYTYSIEFNYHYIRILTKTSTYDVDNNLKIFVPTADRLSPQRGVFLQNHEVLKQDNLETRYKKISEYDNEIKPVYSNLYNKDLSVVAGMLSDGTDTPSTSYNRTDYISLNGGNSAKDLTVTFTILQTDVAPTFVFLYKDKGGIGTNINTVGYNYDTAKGAYIILVNDDYKYMRFMDWGPTRQPVKANIKVTVDKATDLIIKNESLNAKILSIAKDKLDRPTNGVVNFQVSINPNLAMQIPVDTLAVQDSGSVTYNDWGVLFLPENYSSTGTPVRLIIGCHGAGTTITSSSDFATEPLGYLVSQGYAVLDMNGLPKELNSNTPSNTESGLHFGSPLALQSYLKGYNYVMKNYNLRNDGCFVYGSSMGGLTSNMLVYSGSIPVIAQGGFCPVLDHYNQAWRNPWDSTGVGQRAKIANLFNFAGTAPTFTNGYPPSAEEISYYKANIDKVQGYSPIMRNVFNWNTIDPYSKTTGSTDESTAFASLSKYHPVPLKIWHCDDDGVVVPRYSKFFVDAIRNAGGLAYLRKFPSGGHSAWNYGNEVDTVNYNTYRKDTNGDYIYSIKIKASGYELALWFKRFE